MFKLNLTHLTINNNNNFLLLLLLFIYLFTELRPFGILLHSLSLYVHIHLKYSDF